MKTKTVEDTAFMETILEGVKTDLTMLSEEMRSWADNMSGTALENTMKYEQVEECASELEDVQSTVENVEIPEALKLKQITYKYLLPRSRYVGRSWRAGQVSSALTALAENLPDNTEGKDDLENAADTLTGLDFPGMY
jgi:hypothetical protein